jgi:ABC-type molybdate transport system substrate-binding protein
MRILLFLWVLLVPLAGHAQELTMFAAASLTDALKEISEGVMIAGTFPPDSHDPISYPFAVVKAGDTPEARALLTFIAGPEARAVFVQRGFKVE